ncbi:hypothetical protein E3T55_16790 [Cryobacterium frigoriphilum]|uniref:SRPBCC family protein n=1 Tax=Cryobacterium frigoriphilum TaxID=1259150 RepID=A0A4R8ZUT1_9MICO|nr:hypothetical protein [Cryobacterium frigoriphilum]TFD46527.1 hypothetical protein E3T55_16790 [Cryobacterium frigoriphilum]
MRVLLKETLDCTPDAAWRAIHSPAVFREVSSPVMTVESLEADGFPTSWEPGEHPVTMRGLGLVPLGMQVIRLSETTLRQAGTGTAAGNGAGTVRILRDTGRGVSGSMAAVTHWDHRMAIAADPDHPGKTLYRDQLIFRAGHATLAVWPGFWVFWQWRMAQIKRLAPTWRFDLGVDVETPSDTGTGTGTDNGTDGVVSVTP